jgi:hypothetical protein
MGRKQREIPERKESHVTTGTEKLEGCSPKPRNQQLPETRRKQNRGCPPLQGGGPAGTHSSAE